MHPGRAGVILTMTVALALGVLAIPAPPVLANHWCGPLAIGWWYPGIAYVGEVLDFSITLSNGVEVSLQVSAITVQLAWEGSPRDWGPMMIPAFDTRTNTHRVTLPSAPSEYAVSISVNGSAGSEASSVCGPFTKPLSVISLPLPPRVSIRASPDGGPAPLQVDFLATVTEGALPFTYAWSFGDGGSASGPAVAHRFSSAGVYSILVEVTDHRLRSAQASITVTVLDGPSTPKEIPAASDGPNVPTSASFLTLLTGLPISALILTTIVIASWRRRDRRSNGPPSGPLR